MVSHHISATSSIFSPATAPGFVMQGGLMLRFHRTQYEVPGKGRFTASWWQLGSRILRHRERPVH